MLNVSHAFRIFVFHDYVVFVGGRDSINNINTCCCRSYCWSMPTVKACQLNRTLAKQFLQKIWERSPCEEVKTALGLLLSE